MAPPRFAGAPAAVAAALPLDGLAEEDVVTAALLGGSFAGRDTMRYTGGVTPGATQRSAMPCALAVSCASVSVWGPRAVPSAPTRSTLPGGAAAPRGAAECKVRITQYGCATAKAGRGGVRGATDSERGRAKGRDRRERETGKQEGVLTPARTRCSMRTAAVAAMVTQSSAIR